MHSNRQPWLCSLRWSNRPRSLCHLCCFPPDFCPFAQRAWITFLEKEADPANPKLFHFRDVNYYNPSLPETKEFLKHSNTVPVAIHEGQEIKESMPVRLAGRDSSRSRQLRWTWTIFGCIECAHACVVSIVHCSLRTAATGWTRLLLPTSTLCSRHLPMARRR